MKRSPSGFYADSLEMLLDTMCNVLGGIVFLTLVLAQLVHNAPATPPEYFERQSEELSRELSALTASNQVVALEINSVLERLQNSKLHLRTNHMRLPQMISTTKQPWDIIVRYDQLYPLNYLAPNSPGGLTPNTHSIVRHTTADGLEQVEPKPGLGEDAESGLIKMVETFHRLSKTNIYFTFHVYAKSFATFNRIEETVNRLGFQCGWQPLSEETILRVGPSAPIPPQN